MTHQIPTARILLISAGVPLLLVSIALGIVISWLPELPSTIAVHWSLSGVDGYADRAAAPVLLAVAGFGVPVLLTVFLVVSVRRAFGITQKALGAISAGTGAVMAAVFLAVVGVQRGLGDARHAPDIGPWVALAFGIGLAVGVGVWFALPRASRTRVDGSSGEMHPESPLPLAPGERAVWIGTARFSVWASALLILLVGAVAATVTVSAAATGGAAWFLLLIPLLLACALISTLEWRVRVDDSGLHIRGILGLPRWEIPVSDIAAAGTVDVAPLADFGGWGIRGFGARVGLISRSGAALEVRRLSGSTLTVTVDDAATAAQLLSAGVSHAS